MARERLPIDLDNPASHTESERIHIARYRFAAQYVPGKRVLDAACGVGYGSCLLARAGAKSAAGIDISEEAIAFAKEHYKEPNLEYRIGSAYDLSAFRGIETVVSFETVEHIDRPRKFIEQIVAALAPEGTLVISTPNRRSGALRDKPANPFHVQEWTDAEFMGFVSAFFRDVALYGQRFAFQPIGFPGSRTAMRGLAMALAPGLDAIRMKDEIVPYPSSTSFSFSPDFTVAVCKGPIE